VGLIPHLLRDEIKTLILCVSYSLIFVFGIYTLILLVFVRPKNESAITEQLTRSTFEYGMISSERAYLPDNDYKINEITEVLSFLDLYSLQTVELYLNRLNRASDKEIKNSQRLYLFVTGIITALLIVAFKQENLKWLPALLTSFLGFYWVFYSISLDKKNLFARTELCIHVLKESQLIKHQREAQKLLIQHDSVK
jgi:hypothetical protein